MHTRKNIKKIAVTVSLSLAISIGVPAGFTHAAGTTASVNQSGLLQQIFSKFGWNYTSTNTGSTVNKPTVPSSNQPSKPSTPAKPPVSQPPVSKPVTEQEQSNGRLALADKIIKTGEQYMGTPYKYGARSGQTQTFDCSSFVQYVYSRHGIDLPRSSRQQATVGKTIARSQIQKGDLLFFTTSSSGGRIGHVAIYAGNNKVLHTWGPGGVRYDSLSAGWLDKGYVTAKRVIPGS